MEARPPIPNTKDEVSFHDDGTVKYKVSRRIIILLAKSEENWTFQSTLKCTNYDPFLSQMVVLSLWTYEFIFITYLTNYQSQNYTFQYAIKRPV